jgi:hypothetical protein
VKTVGRLAVVSGVSGSWGRTNAFNPRDVMVLSSVGLSRGALYVLALSWGAVCIGSLVGRCMYWLSRGALNWLSRGALLGSLVGRWIGSLVGR